MGETLRTRCCIAGGGPAGMMLGFLLARMGVDVVVLEKHADFLRDFRGDTIHPSTLEIMYELGILDEFLKRPHQEVRQLAGQIGSETVAIADFTHLPTHCKFLGLMPQWDFLNFIVEQARRYPSFHLKMEAEVTASLKKAAKWWELRRRLRRRIGSSRRPDRRGRRAAFRGARAGRPLGAQSGRAHGCAVDAHQPPADRSRNKPSAASIAEESWFFSTGKTTGKSHTSYPRAKLTNCANRGFRHSARSWSGWLRFYKTRVEELRDWDDIKLLTVAVDRLRRWFRPGLLCIGDAAHAMSPIGGVGINLAIQDAVATANILGERLRQGTVNLGDLQAVQRRRTFPTRATQRMQVIVQNNVIRRVLGSTKPLTPPWPVKLLGRWKFLQRIPARVVGLGFRPEHVKTPEVRAA